jgi:hypothetical protein
VSSTRPWPVLAAVLLALLLLLAGRLWIQSRAELREAEAYREAGSQAAAIEHYRRAMRGAMPLNPHPERAAAALESLAEQCEAAADFDCALAAWRAISGSRGAVRWLGSVRDPLRAEADGQIARLLGAHGRVPIDAGLDQTALEASHRERLEHAVDEPRLWRACLLAGFVTWLCGLLWLIAKGFDPRGVIQWPAARRPLSVALMGLTAFALGMLFA